MSRRLATLRLIAVLAWYFLLLTGGWVFGQVDNKDLVAKGQYVFAVAGGCACHTEPKKEANAGARPFPIPFGKVYSTNITKTKKPAWALGPTNRFRTPLLKACAATAANCCR